MEECIFCKVVRGEMSYDKIYENDYTVAFLDRRPASPGHSLVISKKHFETFLDLPEDILCEMIKTTKKVASAIIKVVGADGFNIHINTKKAADQFIFHVHFHIIPRFEGDGIRYGTPPIKYKKGQKEKIMEKIKKVLK